MNVSIHHSRFITFSFSSQIYFLRKNALRWNVTQYAFVNLGEMSDGPSFQAGSEQTLRHFRRALNVGFAF